MLQTVRTLDRLLEERDRVNEILTRSIQARWANTFLLEDLFRCVLPGRKVRSVLFNIALDEMSPGYQHRDDVTLSIELSHAAAVLVDDILDADLYRHGTLATKQEWGTRKACIYAHYLSSTALELVTFNQSLHKHLLNVYERMCIGEMFDILLPPAGQWVGRGYDEHVFQKTSALFEFALCAAACDGDSRGRAPALRAAGRALGRLYQAANDLHDWAIESLMLRHSSESVWPITLSLPLAIYLQQHGPSRLQGQLAQGSLSAGQWREMLGLIWTPEVRTSCDAYVLDAHQAVDAAAAYLPERLREYITQLAELIVTRDFWYHAYDMTIK